MADRPYSTPPPVRATTVMETTTPLAATGLHTHHRISWAAIFGGVILVVAIQLLFSL